MPEECAVQLKAIALRSLNFVITDFQGSINNLNCEKFSTLSRLLRVTAYVVRAVGRFKNREEISANLTPEELAHAETMYQECSAAVSKSEDL